MTAWRRSTATSLFTSALDVVTLTALVELLGIDPAAATFAGTVAGCTSNFAINRAWSFAGSPSQLRHQIARFVPVQAGSSALQTAGVWLLAEHLALPYLLAKALTAVAVYLAWNYPLNRLVVFPPPPPLPARRGINRAAPAAASPPSA